MGALAIVSDNAANVESYRASTNAADMCKAIVVETSKRIGDRNYVAVEGWQAIAVAHGCTASARAVERIEGGVRAVGEVRRMSDGAVIAEAEGFVGEDEAVWFGGPGMVWGPVRGKKIPGQLPKRPDYAIRAMAQTRAISRACRSAFAHVVVMMNAGLQTTPAEEVSDGGYDDAPMRDATPRARTMPEKAAAVPDDFDAGAAGFEIEAELRGCKDKASLDSVWRNSRGLRERIKAADENIHAALVKTFGNVAEGFKPAPQADDVLDDEIPY